MAHRAACDGLTQPFEQAFKTRQALADLRLALLHGSDAEKPAELDGHQHVVRDFPRPEAEIKEQRRQAAQFAALGKQQERIATQAEDLQRQLSELEQQVTPLAAGYREIASVLSRD